MSGLGDHGVFEIRLTGTKRRGKHFVIDRRDSKRFQQPIDGAARSGRVCMLVQQVEERGDGVRRDEPFMNPGNNKAHAPRGIIAVRSALLKHIKKDVDVEHQFH